jgi:hypothetical protein
VLALPALIGAWIRHKSERAARILEKAGSIIGLVFLLGAIIFGA